MAAENAETPAIWRPVKTVDLFRREGRDLPARQAVDGLSPKIIHSALTDRVGYGLAVGSVAQPPAGNPLVSIQQTRRLRPGKIQQSDLIQRVGVFWRGNGCQDICQRLAVGRNAKPRSRGQRFGNIARGHQSGRSRRAEWRAPKLLQLLVPVVDPS